MHDFTIYNMKQNLTNTLFLLLVISTFSSCALIFDGTRYKGHINVENHPNAEIFYKNEKIGVGQVERKFKRSEKLALTIEEEGCEPKDVVYKARFKPGLFIVSAFLWGGIGAGIDVASGASFEPNHKSDSTINKVNSKNFKFNVKYDECVKP